MTVATRARGIALALLLCGAGLATAQEARVRASVDADPAPWAGQQVTLNLDLMTNGTSFSDVHFNLPGVDGAYLLRTDSNTIKRTEQVGGEAWQVVRYPVALFAQAAGSIEVPSIDVRFSVVEAFGQPPRAFELSTEPVAFDVAWPPGAPEGSLVVTTRDFDLRHEWTGAGEDMKAGDALVLRVERRAADISAMLLPPLPVYEADGLAAYPEAPEVTDRSGRGLLVGERVDRITWIVEQAGEYRIPGIRFGWWDPANERFDARTVPGLALTARPAPGAPAQSAASAPPSHLNAWWLLAGALVAGVAWLVARIALRARVSTGWRRVAHWLQRVRRRILPPRRALLARINPGPDS